jgi:hypothetical protein
MQTLRKLPTMAPNRNAAVGKNHGASIWISLRVAVMALPDSVAPRRESQMRPAPKRPSEFGVCVFL